MPLPKNDGNIRAFVAQLDRLRLGIFNVKLTNLNRHPLQRPLHDSWVVELSSMIQTSDYRAQNPLMATLAVGKDDTLAISLRNEAKSERAWLPDHLKLEVFSGQHRVAALERLSWEPESLYWPVEVFCHGWLLCNLCLSHLLIHLSG